MKIALKVGLRVDALLISQSSENRQPPQPYYSHIAQQALCTKYKNYVIAKIYQIL